MVATELTRISRFISRVLRHKPEDAGIALDTEGWASVGNLLAGLRQRGYDIDRALLDQIVASDDKGRYSFSPDNEHIRANQGHSVPVDLGLKPVEPPETLYHGTTSKLVRVIQLEGLKPMKRNYVHLSVDEITAAKNGIRHHKLMMLPIMAGDMHRAGTPFYCNQNGVWLVDAVPAKAIDWAEVRFKERLDKSDG